MLITIATESMHMPNNTCSTEGVLHLWDSSIRIIKRLLNKYTNKYVNKSLVLDSIKAKDMFILNSCNIMQKENDEYVKWNDCANLWSNKNP